MKSHKLGLAILAVALVAPLSACGSHSGAPEEKLNAELTQVDPLTADTIAAEARKNVAGIRHAVGTGSMATDYSGIYTGSLSVYSSKVKEEVKTEINVYDNNFIASKSTMKGSGKEIDANLSASQTYDRYQWIESYVPKTAGDTANFAMYQQYAYTLNDVVVGQSIQENTFKSTDADVKNMVNAFITSEVFDGLVEDVTLKSNASTSVAVYSKGSDFFVYSESSSTGSLTNPAYPSDTTKAIGTLHKTAKLVTLGHDDTKGYFVSKEQEAETYYVARGFDEEADYKDPIVYESSVTESTFAYDSLGAGTLPTKYVPTDEAFVPSLLTFSLDGATQSASRSLTDVTAGYKKIHPSVSADYVYHTETSLVSSAIYSFGYGATPVATDGYSAIKDMRFGTITAVENLDKFFAAQDGTYDIYVFVTKSGDKAVGSYSVTYVL